VAPRRRVQCDSSHISIIFVPIAPPRGRISYSLRGTSLRAGKPHPIDESGACRACRNRHCKPSCPPRQLAERSAEARSERLAAALFRLGSSYACRTTELSDSRPAVITPVTSDSQSASPKPATLELRSGAAVRSSDFVSRVMRHKLPFEPPSHHLHNGLDQCHTYESLQCAIPQNDTSHRRRSRVVGSDEPTT
jgi:hypothetical protein